MRARTVAAASTAAAAALVLAAPTAFAAGPRPAPAAPAATTCLPSALTVSASATDQPHVLKISIKNTGLVPCVVDQIPTVTFGDLDGAAVPVPPAGSAAYPIGLTRAAYAAVRTVDPADVSTARHVDSVRVAGDPSHPGVSFSATSLGSPDGVPVWEPVTTLWHPSWDQAEQALQDALG
ncbi:DUF4232 domain-containing protein [Streptomyces sp. NPDC050560]|uniref:DUF4232 domain-containing protein n=1 Tax=Streptomyces sp. NPDC050560 TaxID=3365630 RepID=UPI00378FE14E